jgi:uncharacterized RDD family membrane protein YckC
MEKKVKKGLDTELLGELTRHTDGGTTIVVKKRTKSSKKDTWNFAVDDSELTSILTRAQLKVSDASVVIKKKRRRISSAKPKKLELDYEAKPERRTREEYSKEEVEDIHDVEVYDVASLAKRSFAFLVDGSIVGGVVFLVEKDLLNLSDYSWYPVGKIGIYLLIYFLTVLLPMTITSASIGKMLVKIKVMDTDGNFLSFSEIFQREVIGKTLSIVTVVGILISLTNYPKRTLHDYWAGTIVVDE